MRHFKIIKTSSDFPDILLYRDRDKNGQEIVVIMAVGIVDEQENMFATESVAFTSAESALSFIKDYTTDSAVDWCRKEGISYW